MCGIIGIVSSEKDVVDRLVASLKLLEYRGYDSAGLATLNAQGNIERRRAKGKIVALEERLKEEPLKGMVGIGHTRWATHGEPNEINAHPHATSRVAMIHNGIIENFQELKNGLAASGHIFESQTDTEVVVHLVTKFLNEGLSPKDAISRTLPMLEGAFALVFVFAGESDLLIGARKGSPLAIGYGRGEMFLGSDALAVGPLAQEISYLEDGDWVLANHQGVEIFNGAGCPVQRDKVSSNIASKPLGKGGYQHFMLKEIYEQPQVIGDTLKTMIDNRRSRIILPSLPELKRTNRLTLVACGTSYYAGLVGKYWIEDLARLPVDIDIASEFRYRTPVLSRGEVALFISQSGETADTLAALRHCRQEELGLLSIVNVPESTIARESDTVVPTLAGPEFGVASTKAFTSQLTILAALAIVLGQHRGHLTEEHENCLVRALTEVPAVIAEILNQTKQFEKIAREILAPSHDVLFLGRGSSYPVALEGALKLKEISYIHAEGYAAGEIKHGPIALVSQEVPVVVLAPSDHLFTKTASNLAEIQARGGITIFVGDNEGAQRLKDAGTAAQIILPKVHPFVSPLVYAVAVQLLAYYTALAKGTDIDQPRNLAKSVTVE